MAPILIIDAGHGGVDPGGGNNAQFTEKNMNLNISLYQYRRFQELNIPVAITRTTDVTLTADQRTQMVRESGARYCISNHINSGGGRGSEVIYSIYGSPQLPNLIQAELKAAGMPNRRIFTRTLPNNPNADYYFMHRQTGSVETVIVEYGFADNAQDASTLASNWEALAEAVIRAFCIYAKLNYRPPTAPPSPTTPPTTTPAPENPGNGGGNNVPEWKLEGINWLYEQGFLSDEVWRQRVDQPLPLWAEALILKRMYEKITGGQ